MVNQKKKTITAEEIGEMLKAGKTISFIPKGELLEYGFCQFGEEDDSDRWCAKDNLCVINLGDKVIEGFETKE